MPGCRVLLLAVLILGGIELVAAQIPSVCANNDDLQNGTCCPDNCGGSTRGVCVNVSTICKTNYVYNSDEQQQPPNDERFNWPYNIFTHVCQCKGNYGGFNCSECKFGYSGDDCSEKLENKRTSITADNFNWEEYHNQLRRAKTEIQSRYKVFTGGNPKDAMNYEEVSLYNLFVWMHHYATYTALETKYPTKDSSAGDYAHESLGFLTWHRIYLLWFEREMQKHLPNSDFTLHYWDWTIDKDRRFLFDSDRLGSHDDESGVVSGVLMNDWYLVCTNETGDKVTQVCDPTKTPGNNPVVRCGSTANCDSQHWPDEKSVRKSINNKDFAKYRSPTHGPNIANKYDTMSFSNYMEGFAVDDNDDCSNINYEESTRRLLCGDKDDEIRRRLHNLVHILLRGTMGIIPLAANDPLFINHHTMIDCLFEQWLKEHPNRDGMYPTSLDPKFAGHAGGDCMVPFLPVYNHSEVFRMSADDFGYSCGNLRSFIDSEDSHTTDPCKKSHNCTGPGNPGNQPGNQGNGAEGSLASATMLISIVVMCLVAVAI